MAGLQAPLERELKTALLVSEGSLYGELIASVLAKEEMPPVWQGNGASLPAFLQTPPCMVIWDLSGFDSADVAWLAQRLKPDHIGLLLVCPQMDRQLMEVALGCLPNQVITQPRTPDEMAAAFFSGLANYERIIGGLSEREHQKQRLSEREVIESAKSLLMKTLDLREAQAMRNLQKLARNSNQRLADVARFVLDASRDEDA